MAKLTLLFNDAVVSEHEIDKEQLTIGRKPDNDIQIDNLSVSGHHARVLTILGDSFVEDTDSTNGTYVNGSLIRKHALQDGDLIVLGKHKLAYSNEEAAEADDDYDDFEKTVVIRPDASGADEQQAVAAAESATGGSASESLHEAAPHADQAAAQRARLRVINGVYAGRELELTKTLTTLGKPGVQVAAISRRSRGYYLIQIEAKDGQATRVNGKSVGDDAVQLEDSALVELGGVKMEFLLD